MSFVRDLVRAPDGCAPDDGSYQNQNPLMRLTDQLLFGVTKNTANNDAKQFGETLREKQMQRDGDISPEVIEGERQRWTADMERARRAENTRDLSSSKQQRARSDVIGRQVAPNILQKMMKEQNEALQQGERERREIMMKNEWERQRRGEREQNQQRMLLGAGGGGQVMQQQQQANDFQMIRERQRAAQWANEFGREREREMQGREWAGEFQNAQNSRAMQMNGNVRAMDLSSSSSAQWAREFEDARGSERERWANEFVSMNNNGAYQQPQHQWANEFTQQRQLQRSQPMQQQQNQMSRETMIDAETRMHSAELARTLGQDPKFANSSFVKLMQNIGSGQVAVRDNDLKSVERGRQVEDDWATEFQSANISGGERWANEFQSTLRREQEKQQTNQTTTMTTNSAYAAENWANEFSSLPEQWANEFAQNNPQYQFETAWNDSMLNDSIGRNDVRSDYIFTRPNPYDGNPNALEIGRDLIKTGVLSEATLALEAAAKQSSEGIPVIEAWRLLGEAHAENDDDVQAIAAMREAHRRDPLDAEVALQLAVSHTNELEKTEAIEHAISWLRKQQGVSQLVEGKNVLDENVARDLFREASRIQPQNANIHAVVGVLAHLTRDYDEAMRAFETAARLSPRDHRLHNKIGATKANAAKSSEAISSYRKALDLKPNYTRAWTNMGIGFANQGRYEASVAYYLRALELNPNAENAWGYLRISLGCTGRIHLMPLVDERNIKALAKEFPLGLV
jgi:peroxin-5